MIKKQELDGITVPATSVTTSSPRAKLSFKVSGARVGDSVRPASDAPAIATTPRFGLRVHRTIAPRVTTPATVIAREDYATADDYAEDKR